MKHPELIKQMTLAEKCGILSGKNTWQTRPVERLNIPSMMMSDGPSGLRKQEGTGDQLGIHESVKATCFPSASTLANSWCEETIQEVGEALAEEAMGHGVQTVLGPGLNTKRSSLCGRNFEYYSEDPYLSGKLAASMIRGLQSLGGAACPKHFAANSQELHRMANDSVVDERTLRELYLTNFEIAVKEGHPKTIMSSYNMVNGAYANENAHLLKEILRDEWGFDGAVISDWGGNNDFTEGTRNGANLEMPGTGDDSPTQLMKAVKEGKISEDEVDARVDELLDVILSTCEGLQKSKKEYSTAKHHETARKAAEKSIVLLKNEDNILPVRRDKSLGLIGEFAKVPRYQGAGSSNVNTNHLVSMMDSASGAMFESVIHYTPGFTRKDEWDQKLADDALEVAKSVDTVLMFMGLPEVYESEGKDRDHLKIPENQIKLLMEVSKVNPKVAVVFSGGSAVEMPWMGYCKAVLWAGLGGEACGEAVMNIVTGDVCPGGKLSETFPARYEDMPVSRYYPGKEKTSEYREGLMTGYRYTETADTAVTFPFGFGLSYTTFEYANIEVSEKEVSFDLTNTGKVKGDEISQVYVSIPESQILRAKKELKGFARTTLESGETKRVTIPLDDKAFRYFNVNTNRFEIEGGEYVIEVGASVREIRLSGKVQIAGTGAEIPENAKKENAPVDVFAVTDEEFTRMLGHEIPEAKYDRSAPLGMNDPIDQMGRAKTGLARLVCRILNRKLNKSLEAGVPDLNILFQMNMPFRGLAKLTGGMLTMHAVEGVLNLVNGHFWKGLGQTVHRFFHKEKLEA